MQMSMTCHWQIKRACLNALHVEQVNPIFEISPLEPRFSEWLVFEGISVDETGRQHYLVSLLDTQASPTFALPSPNLSAAFQSPDQSTENTYLFEH